MLHYPSTRLVLDNHCAHISNERGALLATMPNRFELTLTPGSVRSESPPPTN